MLGSAWLIGLSLLVSQDTTTPPLDSDSWDVNRRGMPRDSIWHPEATVLPHHHMAYIIAHRWSSGIAGLDSGNNALYDLFGLDLGNNVQLGISYGLANRVDFAIWRFSFLREYALQVKTSILSQFGYPSDMTNKLSRRELEAPISLSLAAGVSWRTEETLEPHQRPGGFIQLILERSFWDHWLTISVVPTVSFNTRTGGPDPDLHTFSLGGMLAVRPANWFQFIAEGSYAVLGHAQRFMSYGFGLRFFTLGHTLMVTLSNTDALSPLHYVIGTQRQDDNGDGLPDPAELKLGFSITRSWGFQ